MRQGTNDFALYCDDNEKFIGVSLGHGYCAEHEWGYDGIKRSFGIPELNAKTLGIKSRSTTKCIDALIFKKETYKKKKFAVLYCGRGWSTKEKEEKELPYGLRNYKKDINWRVEFEAKRKAKSKSPDDEREAKDSIITAWDGDSFGIGVMGEENVKYLEDLYNAFLNNNASFGYVNPMPNNPFSHASLSIMITDRIPQDVLDQMHYLDKRQWDKEVYEKKIGMTKLKQKTRQASHDDMYGHQHGYYIACSAKWIEYDDEVELEKNKLERGTKYDIMYWVNYSDDDNTHDHFTVEEVREWLKGKKKLSEIRARNEKKKL